MTKGNVEMDLRLKNRKPEHCKTSEPLQLPWLVLAIKKFRHRQKGIVIFYICIIIIIISLYFMVVCYKLTEWVKPEKYAFELTAKRAQMRKEKREEDWGQQGNCLSLVHLFLSPLHVLCALVCAGISPI